MALASARSPERRRAGRSSFALPAPRRCSRHLPAASPREPMPGRKRSTRQVTKSATRNGSAMIQSMVEPFSESNRERRVAAQARAISDGRRRRRRSVARRWRRVAGGAQPGGGGGAPGPGANARYLIAARIHALLIGDVVALLQAVLRLLCIRGAMAVPPSAPAPAPIAAPAPALPDAAPSATPRPPPSSVPTPAPTSAWFVPADSPLADRRLAGRRLAADRFIGLEDVEGLIGTRHHGHAQGKRRRGAAAQSRECGEADQHCCFHSHHGKSLEGCFRVVLRAAKRRISAAAGPHWAGPAPGASRCCTKRHRDDGRADCRNSTSPRFGWAT